MNFILRSGKSKEIFLFVRELWIGLEKLENLKINECTIL